MSPPIKKNKLGFSLIELLVAVAILGSISVVSVRLLWDTITTRSKQYSIENSADNFRLFTINLTKFIQSAKSISVPNSTTIEITGTPCRTIRLASGGKVIEQAVDNTPSCTPPVSSGSFNPLTKEKINIQTLEFSPVSLLSKVVTIKIEGIYKDSLGEHPVSFRTTVVPRITL